MTPCDQCVVVTFPDHVGVSIALLIVALAICVLLKLPGSGRKSGRSK